MYLILSTMILSLLSFSDGFADQKADNIKKIDSIYDVAESKSELNKLEILIKEYVKVFPKSGEIFWRLARTYFKLGKKSNSESEKIRYFSLCKEQAKKAFKQNSKLAHGYFYNGICSGSLAQVQGIWSSLATIEPFKKDMETALSIDESVEEGGPHRALGNLYLKIPYILGGNLDRSIVHFQKAVKLGPQFGENYLGLAEAYIENGDFILAKEILNTILDMKLNAQKEESILEWQAEATNFLEKIQN